MVLQIRPLLAFALAASAFAAAARTDPVALGVQAEPGAFDSPSTATWNGAVRRTFFTDETSMTLLPEADMRAKWSALSSEDQRLVRQDCTATRGGSVGGADTADAAQPDPAARLPDDDPPPAISSDATGAAGSAVAAGDLSLSHLVQICGLVDRF